MKVLIFEPYHEGHRLHYVRCMLPGLTCLADEVTLAIGRDAMEKPEFHAHLSRLPRGVVIDASAPQFGSTIGRNASAAAQYFCESIRRHRPDHVYLPGADGVGQVLGVWHRLGREVFPTRVPVEALFLRGSFAYPQQSWLSRLKAEMSWAAANQAPWLTSYHLDPLVQEAMRRRGGRLGGRRQVMPDPVERATAPECDLGLSASPPAIALCADVARDKVRRATLRRFGLPEDGRFLGTAGMIDARKGADLLVRAFARAAAGITESHGRQRTLLTNDYLLLAGPMRAEFRRVLEQEFQELFRSGRVRLVDRVLTAEEMRDVVAAMDVVCTPYPRHIGSASIVIRAAAAGRPVLGSNFGWAGFVVPRFHLGHTVDVSDIGAFAEAIVVALEGSAAYQPTSAARRFVEFHSPDNFDATWAQALRQRIGLPPDPRRRTWGWVLQGE